MNSFSSAAVFGLCLGFLWGVGCSLAILYSVYLAGYRKAIKESLKPVKPVRYTRIYEEVLAKRVRKAQRKSPEGTSADASVATESAATPPVPPTTQN
jgi:hypothetical protein